MLADLARCTSRGNASRISRRCGHLVGCDAESFEAGDHGGEVERRPRSRAPNAHVRFRRDGRRGGRSPPQLHLGKAEQQVFDLARRAMLMPPRIRISLVRPTTVR